MTAVVLPFTAASLQYRLENIEIFDIAAGASSAILLNQGQTTKSQITAGLVYDTRDNPFLTAEKGEKDLFKLQKFLNDRAVASATLKVPHCPSAGVE